MLRRFRRLGYAFDSLLGEVLLWILILLLFLWAMSVVMTYYVANVVAHQPYDELLADNVRALAHYVRFEGDHATAEFPLPAKELLRADPSDQVYYQVLAPSGRLIAGDSEIPWVEPPGQLQPGVVYFRDDEIDNEEVRVAYLFIPHPATAEPALVQVAETGKRPQMLSAHIVSGVIVPQFVIVPIAVILVYLALSRGITPLHRLQQELRERRPTDLSPISVRGIPAEIRPMIAALNDIMVRLEENLLGQRRFIADAAHQLKTPLTGLRMQTELALHESDVDHMRDRLRQIALSAERLSHLTRQLLALASAEATTESSDAFQVVDLDQLAHSLTVEWADRAIAKGIELGYEGAGWPLRLIGSPFLLGELISNLLDNAIKYTPPGGQVTVRTLAGVRLDLQVEDNGTGIPIEERERVFERFYRLLGTDTHGSGLGLPIVKEIADLHRATVHLSGRADGTPGTLVAVSFPRPTES
jgi:two-component system sensor histidine kinase TctE